LKISFVEFDKRAREEWAGRTYCYDSNNQNVAGFDMVTVRVKFDKVCTMMNPNCATFRNKSGDMMSLSRIRYVDVEDSFGTSKQITFEIDHAGSGPVSMILR